MVRQNKQQGPNTAPYWDVITAQANSITIRCLQPQHFRYLLDQQRIYSGTHSSSNTTCGWKGIVFGIFLVWLSIFLSLAPQGAHPSKTCYFIWNRSYPHLFLRRFKIPSHCIIVDHIILLNTRFQSIVSTLGTLNLYLSSI